MQAVRVVFEFLASCIKHLESQVSDRRLPEDVQRRGLARVQRDVASADPLFANLRRSQVHMRGDDVEILFVVAGNKLGARRAGRSLSVDDPSGIRYAGHLPDDLGAHDARVQPGYGWVVWRQ